MEFNHSPIMLNEVLNGLNIKENGIYVDGTLGGGGHSEAILKLGKNIKLIAVDKDIEAINHCKQRLKEYQDRVIFVHNDFKNILNILKELNIDKIDGALLDLGVSSYQLDNFERGFSYRAENYPLDMRMDRRQSLSAYDVVNSYSEDHISKILWEYGEEKFSRKIANNIVQFRNENKIENCGQLLQIIYKSIPAAARRKGGNPAKRTFQAIRIEVNGELDNLNSIDDYVQVLNAGGRLCVITFHSLEDRIIKNKFNDLAKGCICPPKTPICICGNKPKILKITKKPLVAREKEIEQNKRSKSAKLRICEKI